MTRRKPRRGNNSSRDVHKNTRKLTFPEYNGNEEPSQWLYKCKKKNLTQNKKEEEQMQLAAFHLHGQALTWFIRLE
jgi:membrane-bound inhibitor of C-type lysozyme